jgi:hypothetical protein
MKAAAIRFPKVRCSGIRLESPRLRLKAILEERFSRQQLRIARQLWQVIDHTTTVTGLVGTF